LRATPEAIQSWCKKGDVTADMVKKIFEHQYPSTSDSAKEYQNTIYGQAGFRVGRGSRPDIVKKAQRTRAESGIPAGRDQRGKKPRQEELSESGGVQGQAHPRLTTRRGLNRRRSGRKNLKQQRKRRKIRQRIRNKKKKTMTRGRERRRQRICGTSLWDILIKVSLLTPCRDG
jgi:hypothetical protein